MSDSHRQRGWVLAQQGRRDLAEREFRLALADDPHDPVTHALLALVLAGQETRRAEALAAARTAVGLAPDDAFARGVEARVHLEAERWNEAERAAREAILIDPDDPDHFGVLAAAHLSRSRWADALDAADEGLELDPEHTACANLRATALVHLDRRDEAGATLHGALARDPDNSHTHANQGWASLHAADRRAALDHFREALRLDPESEWAREGLAEALKARNPLYAAMLRYFLWMERLSPRTRWIVILGGYVAFRLTRGVARSNPGLEPFLLPLMIAYGVFVLLSWTARPLSDAVLMASTDGRYALSAEQRRSGGWMAAGAGVALAFAAAALITGAGWAITGALLFAALLIPLSAVFRGPRRRPSRPMTVAAGAMYSAATLAVVLAATGDSETSGMLFAGTLLAVAATSWIVNLRGQ